MVAWKLTDLTTITFNAGSNPFPVKDAQLARVTPLKALPNTFVIAGSFTPGFNYPEGRDWLRSYQALNDGVTLGGAGRSVTT